MHPPITGLIALSLTIMNRVSSSVVHILRSRQADGVMTISAISRKLILDRKTV